MKQPGGVLLQTQSALLSKEVHMTSCKRVLIRLGYSVIVLTSLASVASRSLASECTHFTSRDATAQEELRLCEREINGPVETYACREYRDAGNRYELLFKGGPAPKAIRQQATGDEQASLRAFSRADAQGQACRQTPPPGVPTHATYRGTGVCLDAKDRSVPCSLFEHAMARDPVAMRYLVLRSAGRRKYKCNSRRAGLPDRTGARQHWLL